jgi:hypothetical protein
LINIYWLGTPSLKKIDWYSTYLGTTSNIWSGTSSSPTDITLEAGKYGVIYRKSSSTMTLTFDSTISSSTVRFVKYTLSNGCYYIYGSH